MAEKLKLCVFKGGTSLSKGFHVINRFSEDIDITFKEHIGESRRKKLKNVVLKGISEELEMPIANWNETQSDSVSVGRFSPFRVGLKTPISVNLKSPMHHVCY